MIQECVCLHCSLSSATSLDRGSAALSCSSFKGFSGNSCEDEDGPNAASQEEFDFVPLMNLGNMSSLCLREVRTDYKSHVLPSVVSTMP